MLLEDERILWSRFLKVNLKSLECHVILGEFLQVRTELSRHYPSRSQNMLIGFLNEMRL